jgi:hypothetical protein
MGLKFRGIPVPDLTTPEFRWNFRGIPGAEFRSVEFHFPVGKHVHHNSQRDETRLERTRKERTRKESSGNIQRRG